MAANTGGFANMCADMSFVSAPMRTRSIGTYLHLVHPRKCVRRAVVTRACAENGRLDGELRDMYDEALKKQTREGDSMQWAEADRRVMDGIAEVGVDGMRVIAGGVQRELARVGENTEDMADALIAEEMTAILEKHEGDKAELLAGLGRDRKVIQEEFERIQELAESLKSPTATNMSDMSLSARTLFIATGLFVLGALFFAFNGTVTSDGEALVNAVIDAIVAAICAFLYTRERRSSENSRATDSQE